MYAEQTSNPYRLPVGTKYFVVTIVVTQFKHKKKKKKNDDKKNKDKK